MSWEFSFLDFLDIIRCNFLDSVFVFITHLGDKGYIWIAMAALLLIFKKTRKIGVCVAIALIFGVLVGNAALKPLIARTRPFDARQGIELLINAPKDYSFPSGHTLSSFAGAGVVFWFNKKYAIPCFVLAFLIAFSRLYLYVHYPTDVLGGVVIGLILSYAAYRITQYIFARFFENKEA